MPVRAHYGQKDGFFFFRMKPGVRTAVTRVHSLLGAEPWQKRMLEASDRNRATRGQTSRQTGQRAEHMRSEVSRSRVGNSLRGPQLSPPQRALRERDRRTENRYSRDAPHREERLWPSPSWSEGKRVRRKGPAGTHTHTQPHCKGGSSGRERGRGTEKRRHSRGQHTRRRQQRTDKGSSLKKEKKERKKVDTRRW